MKPMHLTALAVATAASGFAFATQYLTVEQAQHAMFPDATAFRDANLQLSTEQMRQGEKLSGLPARSVGWRVFAAYRGDIALG